MDVREALHNARALLHIHGLDSQGWRVVIDNAKGRAGICKYRSKTIGLSRMVTEMHSAAEVEQTVKHEIAHAIAGSAAQHGPEWRRVFLSIGGDGHVTTTLTAEQRQSIVYKWVGTCKGGHTFNRHKLTQSLRRYGVCPRCPRDHNQISWVDTASTVR